MSYSVNCNLDKKKWSSFVDNHPHGNIFQTPEMYEVYYNTRNYEPILLGVVDENYNILGLLLSVIQKEHNGLLSKFSSRSIIDGGPLIKDNDIEVLDYLLSAYNKKIKRKVIYSQFRNQWTWNDKQKSIFAERGLKYEPHLDIIHHLKATDKQWMDIHKGRRKNIRRAERLGLVFNEIQNYSEFERSLELVKATYRRLKLPMPDKSLFIKSFQQFADKGVIKIFVALLKNEIIATRMVFCYKDLIYDWYAGAANKHLDNYPNDFLPWKVMEWSANNGYKYFDFGGAGKPGVPYGVRDYKLKFGGELVEFGRFNMIHKPFMMKLGKFGLIIYKMIKR